MRLLVLFRAKRLHRVEPRSTPRRHEARCTAHESKEQRGRKKNRRMEDAGTREPRWTRWESIVIRANRRRQPSCTYLTLTQLLSVLR